MRLLIEELNPEPWRAPKLGIRRMGKRSVPQAFKDENLRSYQEALSDLVSEALDERALPKPVFPKGTPLIVRFQFWRSAEGLGRNVRHYADATNLLKAAEDALQGLVYYNDKSNVSVSSELVAFGPLVKPLIAIEVEEAPVRADTLAEKWRLMMTHPSAKSGCVWLDDTWNQENLRDSA